MLREACPTPPHEASNDLNSLNPPGWFSARDYLVSSLEFPKFPFFDLVSIKQPFFHVFSEMLMQSYPVYAFVHPGRDKTGYVILTRELNADLMIGDSSSASGQTDLNLNWTTHAHSTIRKLVYKYYSNKNCNESFWNSKMLIMKIAILIIVYFFFFQSLPHLLRLKNAMTVLPLPTVVLLDK